jgi:hypothetical protein
MKKINILLISLICTIALVAQDDDESNLMGFIVGEYSIIGKHVENDKTYFGTMKINLEDSKFIISRKIGNKTIKADGRLKKTGPDKIEVFVISFTENKVLYEITYLIDTDFDNYGRLSGYRYYKDKNTEKPGLEALFINH